MATTAAILLAGGSGSRMRGTDNKVFADVAGRPMVAWSVRTFVASPRIDVIVLVVRAGEHHRVRAALTAGGVAHTAVRLTTGGATRQDSERAGLEAVASDAAVDLVLIHDTARPFVSGALIDRVADAAGRVGGAIPVLPLGPGIHRLTDGHLEPQPADLYRVQTPQAFRAQELLTAYRQAADDGFAGVDTAETVQRYTTLQIAAVPGDGDNIKVTFAADLASAQDIARRRDIGDRVP